MATVAPLRIVTIPSLASAVTLAAAPAVRAAPAAFSSRPRVSAPVAAAPAAAASSVASPAAPPAVASASHRKKQPATTQIQGYTDRLIKLIPAEVISLYMVGIGVIPPTASKIALVVWAIICFAFVIMVRAYTTGDRASGIPPQWTAVFISTISFVIWLYISPGPFQAYGLAVPYIGSLAVMVWTFLVPFVYKGDIKELPEAR